MEPCLWLMKNGRQEKSWELEEGKALVVGRNPASEISMSDPSVSKQHCTLLREGGTVLIRDLGSRNGTLVNDSAVRERRLENGDRIGVGDTLFLFQSQEDNFELPAGDVVFDETSASQPTVLLRPRDAMYLQPAKLLGSLATSEPLARNLNALLTISRVVSSERNLERLQRRILHATFEVCPAAERGAILLDPRGGEKFRSICCEPKEEVVHVSSTITRQVMGDGVAVLGSDVPHTAGLSAVESLIAAKVHSFLCVPLPSAFDRVIGCIYLVTTNHNSVFQKDDLEMVSAIACLSASALENAQRLAWLEQENERLAAELGTEHHLTGDAENMGLVGQSPSIKNVRKVLKKVAPSNATVLITGESGTGKELAARAIHQHSDRKDKPFVAINCAALAKDLLESELFGHEKGSFTGAVGQKKGKLEVADGGVLFLDEIGEMPMELQVKLLRVLAEREFERVGGTKRIYVDIRLVAATNRNLEEEIEEGRFRQDLYFRLNVVPMVMPPLRDREIDVPMLAQHFVDRYTQRGGMKPKTIALEALACLRNYDWPGNVRELENAMERAVVMGSSDVILPEDLPESLLERAPAAETADDARYHKGVRDLKRKLVSDALEEANGNVVEAAKKLGMHANNLHRLIRNLGLRNKDSGKIKAARG